LHSMKACGSGGKLHAFLT